MKLPKKELGRVAFQTSSWTLHPVLDDFRALDLDLLARGGLIDDALGVGLAAARRADALAVDALVHGDHVARLGEIGGALDGAQRGRVRAGVGVVAAGGDVELGGGGRGGQRDGGEGIESGFWSCCTPKVKVCRAGRVPIETTINR